MPKRAVQLVKRFHVCLHFYPIWPLFPDMKYKFGKGVVSKANYLIREYHICFTHQIL